MLESRQANPNTDQKPMNFHTRSSQDQRRYLCTSVSVGSFSEVVGEAMECFCYLRNIQDKLADRKSPCEKKIWNFI